PARAPRRPAALRAGGGAAPRLRHHRGATAAQRRRAERADGNGLSRTAPAGADRLPEQRVGEGGRPKAPYLPAHRRGTRPPARRMVRLAGVHRGHRQRAGAHALRGRLTSRQRHATASCTPHTAQLTAVSPRTGTPTVTTPAVPASIAAYSATVTGNDPSTHSPSALAAGPGRNRPLRCARTARPPSTPMPNCIRSIARATGPNHPAGRPTTSTGSNRQITYQASAMSGALRNSS